jgi:CheY-like chemotaxis protein
MAEQSPPKILCIEDSATARALVRRLLEKKYLVLEAGDPLAGIELAKDTLPDLVLLDLSLPNLTGYVVATRLKTIVPEAPLVAVTVTLPAWTAVTLPSMAARTGVPRKAAMSRPRWKWITSVKGSRR